jgi:hypothetical protein
MTLAFLFFVFSLYGVWIHAALLPWRKIKNFGIDYAPVVLFLAAVAITAFVGGIDSSLLQGFLLGLSLR